MHRLTSLARYLVLALVGLLFLQWPLREWVHAYARQANDLGQIVFACYVAIAVTATSINNKHLAGNHKAGHLRAASRSAVGAMALCTLPWALFMVWAGWRPVMLAIQRAERFPESFSPGYYGISMAMALLVLLHLWHALFAVRLGNQAHT